MVFKGKKIIPRTPEKIKAIQEGQPDKNADYWKKYEEGLKRVQERQAKARAEIMKEDNSEQ